MMVERVKEKSDRSKIMWKENVLKDLQSSKFHLPPICFELILLLLWYFSL